MKYFDCDNDKLISEKELRLLDFEENIGDLNRNKADIFDGIINIESICEGLQNAINGNIKEVIQDLNLCWDFNIEILYTKEELEQLKREKEENNKIELKNIYSKVIFKKEDLYKNYLEELEHNGINKKRYSFKEWTDNLLSTGEYEKL